MSYAVTYTASLLARTVTPVEMMVSVGYAVRVSGWEEVTLPMVPLLRAYSVSVAELVPETT